jgi:hypothetical protein
MSGVLGRAAICAAAVLLLALPASASAAPPGNDSRANAAPIAIGAFLENNSNEEATTNPAGEALTSGNGGTDTCDDGSVGQVPNGHQLTKTVWWTFEGNGQRLTVSTKFSDFDTIVAVYTQDQDGFLVFEGCNDDLGDGGFGSELVVPTDDNVQYWIQVGGCDQCPLEGGGVSDDAGSIDISLDAPPLNDQRAGARPVDLGKTVDQLTFGAVTDNGEAARCGTVDYGKTTWYRFSVPASGTVSISASGFPLVASLYPANGGRLQCSNGSGTSATLQRRLPAGAYLVQVGGKGAGTAASDGRVNVRVDFAKDPDPPPPPPPPPPNRDGDAFPDASDKCPDENSLQRDANGDGCLDALPRKRLSADVTLRASGTGTGYRIRYLRVEAPKGSKITVRCGRRCKFSKKASVARVVTIKQLAGRTFRFGQKIRIYVTRKNAIGAYIQLHVRRGEIKQTKRCLPVGSMKPKKRCR